MNKTKIQRTTQIALQLIKFLLNENAEWGNQAKRFLHAGAAVSGDRAFPDFREIFLEVSLKFIAEWRW